MTVYLIVVLLSISVAGLVFLVLQLQPSKGEVAVKQRLAEVDEVLASPFGQIARRRRQAQRERYEELVKELGEWILERRTDTDLIQTRLLQGGFRSQRAAAVFWGLRLLLTFTLPPLAFLGASVLGYEVVLAGLTAAFAAGAGWIVPSFYLDHRIRQRQIELRRVLPDALDLLVVCVEAGMGLNQAMQRVADEIRHVSGLMAEELTLVNLEIRAGVPRDEALRNLASRTGVEDISSIVGMLIQADRFGTSIGQALRTSSDTQRVRRAQDAEEMAAKMPIKMMFPMAVCIFPAILLIIMGPAVLQIIKAFSGH